MLNCIRQILLNVDDLRVAALRKPTSSSRFLRHRTIKTRSIRQLPRTPCLELVPHLMRIALRGNDHVDMICSSAHGMHYPPADPTMIAYRLLDQSPLFITKYHRRFHHPLPRLPFLFRISRLDAPLSPLDPSARISWEPSAITRPGDVISECGNDVPSEYTCLRGVLRARSQLIARIGMSTQPSKCRQRPETKHDDVPFSLPLFFSRSQRRQHEADAIGTNESSVVNIIILA